MAITNHERVGKALGLLKDGLRPFVERELQAATLDGRIPNVRAFLADTRFSADDDPLGDAAALLNVMIRSWDTVFRSILGRAERTLVHELSDVRNRWAHQNPFSGDDTDRALDSIARLLTSISAPEADEVGKMKM